MFYSRLVSARLGTDLNPAQFCSGSSICWRQLAFRTITSSVSRRYESSKLEPPPLSPEHDIYISTSTDPFFNLTLEDWYVSIIYLSSADFFELLQHTTSMHNSFSFQLY